MTLTPAGVAGTMVAEMPELHHIWFLAVPGLQALDLVGPHEVFVASNRVADQLGRGGPRYRTAVVAAGSGVVESESGLGLLAVEQPPPPAAIDTLVIPGGGGVRVAAGDAELVALTRDLSQRAERVATICTGSFLAAAAGLLAGRRACWRGGGWPPIGPEPISWLGSTRT